MQKQEGRYGNSIKDVLDKRMQLKATLPPEMESFDDYYERTWVATHTTSSMYIECVKFFVAL